MRVTKIIREYVEESVAAKFAPAYEALKKKYQLGEADKAAKEVQNRLNDLARKEYRTALAPYYAPEDLEVLTSDGSYFVSAPNNWSRKPTSEVLYAKERALLDVAESQAVKDILLELELGATKADLDRLLSEVSTEVEM